MFSLSKSTTAKNSTLLFFHGLGDCGESWQPQLASLLSNFNVKCPTAPTSSVTINFGMKSPSWFDIKGLDGHAPEDKEGIEKAAKNVHELINTEISGNIPPEKIILGGFSQGGALALYSGLTYPKKLGGIIALSCWLPLNKEFPHSLQDENKNIPILQCHGSSDSIVPLHWAEETQKVLKNTVLEGNINFVVYPGMAHSSCQEEFVEMRKFANKCISDSK